MTYLNQCNQAGVASKVAVVGYNPENADVSNPSGAILREVFFVAVESDYGYIYSHFHRFENEEEAQALANKVNDAIFTGLALNPVHWTFERLRYGSEAYDGEGGEEELVAFEKGGY